MISPDHATLNPLFQPKGATSNESQEDTAHSAAPLKIHVIQKIAIVCLACVWSLLCCLLAVLGMHFARGPISEFAFSSILAFTVSEIIFLPMLNVVGMLALILFLTGTKVTSEKHKFIVTSLILVFVFLIVALTIVGPLPAQYVKESTLGVSRGQCHLYKQGFASSEPRDVYDGLAGVCKDVGDSPQYFAINADVVRGAQMEKEHLFSLVRLLDDALVGIANNERTLHKDDAPVVMDIFCSLVFRPCNSGCQVLHGCNFLTQSWYDMPRKRRKKLKNFVFGETVERAISDLARFLKNTHETQTLLTNLNNIIRGKEMYANDFWENPPNQTTCFVASNTTKKGQMSALPCDINFIEESSREYILNSSHEKCKIARLWILMASILFSSIPVFVFACGDHTYRKFPELQFSWQSVTFLMVLFTILSLGTLATYGGSLIAATPVEVALGMTFVKQQVLCGLYFVVSLSMYFSITFFLQLSTEGMVDKAPDGNQPFHVNTNSWLTSKLAVLREHKTVAFLRDCNDPRKQEFLYRIVFMECLEFALQVGAMLLPQKINGDIVTISVILVTVNACILGNVLYCCSPSPARMTVLLASELLFDLYFSGYGILRLQSNINLSFIEHLALLKPLLSLNIDLYDFVVLILFARGKNHSISAFTCNLDSYEDQRIEENGVTKVCIQRRRVMYTILLNMVVLPAGVLLPLVRYFEITSICRVTIGPVALCARERYYFNVPGGIFGEPCCSFEQVTSLDCTGGGISYVDDSIGTLMPNLKLVNISHNTLQRIPLSLGSIGTLESVDISFTNVNNFPHRLATAKNLKTLSVSRTPVSQALDWSRLGLVSLETNGAFTEAFAPTLENLDLSHNALTSNVTSTAAVCRFKQIRYLNLSTNHISNTDEFARPGGKHCSLFLDFPNLVSLDISRNRISSIEITRVIVEQVNKLSLQIFLQHNNIRACTFTLLDEETEMAYAMKQMFFPTGTIRDVRFHGCVFRNLSTILPWPIAFRKITKFEARSTIFGSSLNLFRSFQSLQNLNVPRTALKGSLFPLKYLKDLRFVDVAGNLLIGSLVPLQHLTNIEYLRITDNDLSGSLVPINALHSIKRLFAGSNSLSGTLEPLKNLKRMLHLYLYKNSFRGELRPLENMTNLRGLKLYGNLLTGTLRPIEKLRFLEATSISVEDDVCYGNMMKNCSDFKLGT